MVSVPIDSRELASSKDKYPTWEWYCVDSLFDQDAEDVEETAQGDDNASTSPQQMGQPQL